MTHALSKRNVLNPWNNPLVVSLRYRCECATNEVLTIQVVLDKDTDERTFLWTMTQLWKDMKFEVLQHIEGAKDD